MHREGKVHNEAQEPGVLGDLDVRGLRRRLVPLMRDHDISKVKITVTQSHAEVGSFEVERDHFSLVIIGDTNVTFFPVRGRHSKKTSIEKWLSSKFNCDPYVCTFIVTDPSVTIEKQKEEAFQTAPKKKRIPKRRKTTKKDLAERQKKKSEEAYQNMIALMKTIAPGTENRTDLNEMRTFVELLPEFAGFLMKNHLYKNRFLNFLEKPEYAHIKKIILIASPLELPSVRRRELHSEIRKAIADLQALIKITDIIKQKEGSDPFRSKDALYNTRTTDRFFHDYVALLFPEYNDISDFTEKYAGKQKKELWVDMGSGTTYENAFSLTNIMPMLNQDIKIIGVDMLYGENTALISDQVAGRAKLKREKIGNNILVGASAQMSPFAESSIDQYMSLFVYDKFNTDNEGGEQALREAALMLKEGGLARIYPFTLDTTSQTVTQYFTVSHEQEINGYKSVILRRKKTSKTGLQVLRTAIAEWKKENVF